MVFCYSILSIQAWNLECTFVNVFALITEESPCFLISLISPLSLLFFGTRHSNGYIFPFLLYLSLLLFSAICKASSDNHFAFLNFFFLGMILITASCTMSQTSIHSSLLILTATSRLLHLYSTNDKTSRLMMKSFSTVRDTQRGSPS